MANDTKDDVDRLFACFKCGLSTPESALKERKILKKKARRVSLAKEESSSANEATEASCSKQRDQDSPKTDKVDSTSKGLPCHIYFDVEFSKKVNTSKNVDEMVDTLISITLKTLCDKYSIRGNEDWVIELDSSTEEKFSRHLVIRIPKTAFKDNSHVGAFVSEVCSRITSLRESDPQYERLYIRKDSSSSDHVDQLFVDSGVYTRNRCFRLALSSKAGKNAFLLPTGRFRCKDLVHKHITDAPRDISLHAWGNDFPRSYFSGKSPFPALDAFVESIASIGNVSGKIRSWYWFSAYGLMIYSMSRNRYCERIGREHKSNHVIYIVDFQRAGYYQKCHDPDCKGYRSPLRPLPWDVYYSTLSENFTEALNSNLDLQPNEISTEYHTYEAGRSTDSCKKDSGWWQEAISYADFIESLRTAPHISKLEDDMDEDCEWWMDAVKIASQVEEQIS